MSALKGGRGRDWHQGLLLFFFFPEVDAGVNELEQMEMVNWAQHVSLSNVFPFILFMPILHLLHVTNICFLILYIFTEHWNS